MKNNCDMARDLMPLTIDGVASEASQTYVNEHLEECAECRAYLEGMKAALADDSQRVEKEREDFGRTAARLRLRRRLKKAMTALIVLVVAIGALYAGTYAHSAYNTAKIPLKSSEYSVTLSQLEDGRVIVTAKTHGKSIMDLFVDDMPLDSGGRYGLVTLMSTRGSSVPRGEMEAYELPSAQGYDSIMYGDGEPAMLWTRGETIAPASPEMEAYYAAYDALEAFERETEKRHLIQKAETGDYSEGYWLTPQEQGEEYDLTAALEDAKAKVPEWDGRVRQLETEEPMG
ncbi:MAG: zf-HC2 domain-containing protein [Clostridia bacterium]|nr:zf-HC2 domain-containing protein [Clostridia bacterium]